MRIGAISAVLLVAVVTAAVTAVAAADDPSTAVQTDLGVLASDIRTYHDTLLPDLASVTAAARANDRTGLLAALAKLTADRRAVAQVVLRDRHQLRADLTAAAAAGVTGLTATVNAAIVPNHLLLRDVRLAERTELRSIQVFRRLIQTKSS
jgi:hypothetical protein